MQKATEESQFDEPTARLCAWYRGEAGGEAYFLAMAEHGETPDIRQKWQLLGELEHVMGKRLLAAHEEALLDFAVAEADGRDGSAAVRELLETWQN